MDIRKIERDPATWNRTLETIRSLDLVLWAFPLNYLVVCSQYKRFIERVFERNAQDSFTGKYAASLSTSIHFFDQTAHAYIHAVSDDLGMKYLGFLFRGDAGSLTGRGTDTPGEICLTPHHRG